MYGRVIGMRMADYRRWYADKVEERNAAQEAAKTQQDALEQQQESTPATEEDG